MIAGNMLVVRLSKAGENFTSLTGKAYRLEDGMTVVADSSGIISLGGITGGKATSCTVDTDTVFLESALFDPVRTAVTGRCLAISSDARYRFERGIDPCTVFEGIEQATRMILELCGGNASTLVVAGNVPTWQRQIIFQTSQVLNLSGVDLPKTEQARILINLGFQVTEVGNGSTFAVDIPSWRVDIHSEADLVEEIIRVCGYDSIPSVPLPGTLNTSFPITLTHHHSTMLVKRVLAVRGLSEAVTWSFMDSSKAILFGSQDPGLHLQNPITNNLDVMRPSLLPNLMTAAVSSAARGQVNAALFEVGPSWTSPQPSGQQLVVGGLRAGDARSRHWAESARPVDVFDVKADALAVLSTLGVLISDLEITADAPRWYHPGRSGCLRQGSTVVAQFGEIHPAIIVAFDADRLLVGFEVFLNAVSRPREKKALLKLVPFQPIERDFAFIVDDSVTSDKVVNAARAADKILIVKVSVFDIYRGIGVPPNCKSIAITVTLQPVSGTLTDEQIGDVVHRIVESVNKQTGAILRG
jgi:phenylalanyl-tRNA synthetase beta chain